MKRVRHILKPVILRFVMRLATLTSLLLFSASASDKSYAQDLTGHDPSDEYLSIPAKEGPSTIREAIPAEYRRRYLKWKREYLSTSTGREQWKKYSSSPYFTLTITVSALQKKGAKTTGYRWNESDQLIAATIILGSKLDEGFPQPATFPVLNALRQVQEIVYISGDVLAAAKIAHEFGHVNLMVRMDGSLYRLQQRLVPLYNQTFFAIGQDCHNPRLVEMAARMGGRPDELELDREYWAEANALAYLRERCPEEGKYKPVFQEVRRNVKKFTGKYAGRFQ